MTPTSPDSFEKRGWFQRFGFFLGLAGVAVIVAVIFVGQSLFSKKAAPPHKAPEVTMVKIVSAPPPPPPPPPPPQKMLEEKMIEQAPVDDSESKPEQSAAPAVADVGTSIKGEGGSDAFGLSGSRKGGTLGGSGAARSAASRWGWYAGEVQSVVGDALRRHPRTRDANFRIEVRIWPDLTGRVTRAQLVRSTGDAAIDEAIRTEVLAGLQLKEAPPAGMPVPIVMRLTARRPN